MDQSALPTMTRRGVPIFRMPTDPLTHGISSVRSETTAMHPVEAAQKTFLSRQSQTQDQMLARTYGSHFPMRINMEKQILSQMQRLPGLHSEFVGLSTLLDLDETIQYEDFLNDPRIAYQVKGL
eukprot:TRINITY_DN3141_c0_g1_i1.p1 TRINITY_DN3141_c0_g1~~TRINITY_DN3141_c0_g1_i1.p1  ORF type:complete len:124 (+),score=21.57 TRINITY_DN3141_c0_g1_i1:80-451(+)